jgi:hypothetical protein
MLRHVRGHGAETWSNKVGVVVAAPGPLCAVPEVLGPGVCVKHAVGSGRTSGRGRGDVGGGAGLVEGVDGDWGR